MRVSQTLLNNLVTQKTRRAQAALVDSSSRLSASSAVERPSDDPAAAARLRRLQRSQARLETLDRNRQTVRGDLQAAETLLDGIHEQLVQAHELAMRMSNDSMSAADRESAARELELAFQQVIGLTNRRQSGNRYLFGGLRDDVPALSDDGRYNGNDLNRVVEVAPDIRIEATISARDVFGANMEYLEAISDLAATLRDPGSNDNGQAVAQYLDVIDEARERVSLVRTEVGTRLARLEEIDALSAELATSVKLEMADIEGVDFAAGAADYAAAQTALNAVIETSRKMLDYGSGSWLR